MEQVRSSDSSSQAVPGPGQPASCAGAPSVAMKKRKPMPPPRPRSSGGVEATATDCCCHPPSSPQRPPAACLAALPQPLHSELLIQEKGPFTLSEFVSKFSRSLPICVSVERGYHSDDERHCIANGDKYDVHFVKRSKVAVLKDSTGTKYSIPLSSPIQFSPIFSKDSSDSDSDSEQIFDCVAEVVALKPLPRLLRATKNYTKDDKLLVEKNEILVVNKVAKKKSLQVYSVLHNREKCLPYDCEGGFTADQYATRLHLPDLISLFLDEFPLRVRVYLTDIELTGGEQELDLPYHLSSEASVVTELQTEISLVASTHWEEGQRKSETPADTELIDIPIDLQIEVSILQPDKREQKKDLFKRTRDFFDAYNQAKVQSIRISSSDLTSVMRPGHERVGVELEEPESLYATIPPREQQTAQPEPRLRRNNHSPKLRVGVQQRPQSSPPVARKPSHLLQRSQETQQPLPPLPQQPLPPPPQQPLPPPPQQPLPPPPQQPLPPPPQQPLPPPPQQPLPPPPQQPLPPPPQQPLPPPPQQPLPPPPQQPLPLPPQQPLPPPPQQPLPLATPVVKAPLCGQYSLDSGGGGTSASVRAQSQGGGRVDRVDYWPLETRQLDDDSPYATITDYVTMAPSPTPRSRTVRMSEQMPGTTFTRGDGGGMPSNAYASAINMLIGRIQSLEETVAALTDKVNKLSKN